MVFCVWSESEIAPSLRILRHFDEADKAQNASVIQPAQIFVEAGALGHGFGLVENAAGKVQPQHHAQHVPLMGVHAVVACGLEPVNGRIMQIDHVYFSARSGHFGVLMVMHVHGDFLGLGEDKRVENRLTRPVQLG